MMDGSAGDEFLSGIFNINAVFAGAVFGWIEAFSSQRLLTLMSILRFLSVCGVAMALFAFFGANFEGKSDISPWAVIAFYTGACVTFAVAFLLTNMGRRHYVKSQTEGGQQ